MILNDNQKKIENYSIDMNKQIGQGQFSKVYMGKNIVNNQKVAVKIIQREKIFLSNENYNCMIDEILILKQLNHPNILKIYDIYQTKNNIYIISEYCNQVNLQNFLNQQKFLNENQVKNILIDLFKGFKYLTEKQIVHRDIKPDNIFIHKDDNKLIFKIGDFGFAIKDLKTQNQVIGTPYYMSPQKALGMQYSNKADIWSIGVLIYELLTGNVPWKSKNFNDLQKEINKPLVLGQNISKKQEQLIRQCLQIEEDKRINWEELFNHEFLNEDLKSTIDTQNESQQGLIKQFIQNNYKFVTDDNRLKLLLSHFIYLLIKQQNFDLIEIKQQCKQVKIECKLDPYIYDYFQSDNKIDILLFLLQQKIRQKSHQKMNIDQYQKLYQQIQELK